MKQIPLDILNRSKTTVEYAEEYGVNERTIRRWRTKLAKEGHDHGTDVSNFVPEGYKIRGTSSLIDGKGNIKLQWVKTDVDRDRQEELMRVVLEEFLVQVPRQEPIEAPIVNADKLCNLFTITDYHIGMGAYADETGEDWNIEIAKETLRKWFEVAVKTAPDAQQAILCNLGDFLHFDSLVPVTPSHGHILESDGTYTQMVRVAIDTIRYVVNLLLAKYPKVHLIMAEGNHDLASSVWLREMLAALYEHEPRLTIERSADPYYAFMWGTTMLGFHHGHKSKIGKLDSVFASKFKQMYGASKAAYLHTGHYHHLKVNETSMFVTEMHRTLAAPDAYASRGGYMSGSSATVICYHKDHGEIGRLTIGKEMLK